MRRRLREEEEGRVHPHRLKVKQQQRDLKGKAKASTSTRPDHPPHKYSYGRLGEASPHRTAAAVDDGGDPAAGPPHQSSSPAAPATSSDHPEPEGAQLISGARHVLHALTGNKDEEEAAEARRRAQEERDRLPSDAVDLVVQDYAAEEEEQIQARRRGEPGGKRKRVYRVTYVSPQGETVTREEGEGKGQDDEVAPSPLPNEHVELKDSVPREPEEVGASEAASSEEVKRLRIVEEEMKSRMVEGPPPAPSEEGERRHGEDNPWE